MLTKQCTKTLKNKNDSNSLITKISVWIKITLLFTLEFWSSLCNEWKTKMSVKIGFYINFYLSSILILIIQHQIYTIFFFKDIKNIIFIIGNFFLNIYQSFTMWYTVRKQQCIPVILTGVTHDQMNSAPFITRCSSNISKCTTGKVSM